MEKQRKGREFEDRYKSKAKSAINPRALRGHRRSVEWKQKRDVTFNQTRQLPSVSEDHDDVFAPPEKTKSTKSAPAVTVKPQANKALSRREQLEKWKAEKALKKKLTAQDDGKRANFKVTHTAKDILDYAKPFTKLSNVPATTAGPSRKTAPVKAAPVKTAEGPCTRTRSRAAPVTAPTKKKSPVKKKAATRTVKPAATKPVKAEPKVTRATRSSSKAPTVAPLPKKLAPAKTTAKKNAKKTDIASSKNVNKSRGGTSFAPEEFKFTAPDHLKSFDFNPMSPATVKSFLSINPADSPASRRCSTPKRSATSTHSKTPNLAPISQASSSDSDGASSDKDRRRTRRSVRVAEAVSGSESSSERLLCKDDLAVVRVKESSGVAQVASPKKNDATPSRRKTRRSIAQEEEEVVVPAKEEPLVEKREETPMSSKSDTEAQLPTLFEEGDGDACVFKTPSQSAVRRQRRLTSAEHLSSKRKKTFSTRNSLILRTLSPEEGVEILKNSPMIEMNRRKSKTPVLVTADVYKQEEEKEEQVMQQLLLKFTEEDQLQKEISPPEQEEKKPVEKDSVQPTSLVDVSHFRNLMTTETERLSGLCDHWNQILTSGENPDLSEDISGQIRTTVGQAQLLMAQRFKQFNGLVDNCEFGLGEKETTTTDLTGFWEMIYFQVEDVNVKFDELVKLKAAGWKKVEPVKEKIIKKKPVATKKTVTGAKSKFAAYRAKMLAQKKGREDVEKPESPKAIPAVAVEAVVDPSETKTFYAGFFSVSSPVRNTSQPSSAAPTPKASARKSLVRPRRSTPLGGSPFLRAVLNSSLRRSLSKRSLDTSLFTDPVAPPTETPKRMLSEVDEVSESESVVATGTPRRSTRRSVRLSQLQNVPSTQKGGGDSMAQYFLPTEHKENALTPVNQSSKIDDSISFKDSPVFPETPRTYSRKRGASLLFTPISSPAKKSRPSGTEDLMCFSPLPSPATPTPKSVV